MSRRPINLVDANERPIYDSVDWLAFRGEYTGENIIYKGYARPGSPTTAAVWQIAKLTYDSANVISITWPVNSSGAPSNDFEFIWDNRASLVYA